MQWILKLDIWDHESRSIIQEQDSQINKRSNRIFKVENIAIQPNVNGFELISDDHNHFLLSGDCIETHNHRIILTILAENHANHALELTENYRSPISALSGEWQESANNPLSSLDLSPVDTILPIAEQHDQMDPLGFLMGNHSHSFTTNSVHSNQSIPGHIENSQHYFTMPQYVNEYDNSSCNNNNGLLDSISQYYQESQNTLLTYHHTLHDYTQCQDQQKNFNQKNFNNEKSNQSHLKTKLNLLKQLVFG